MFSKEVAYTFLTSCKRETVMYIKY